MQTCVRLRCHVHTLRWCEVSFSLFCLLKIIKLTGDLEWETSRKKQHVRSEHKWEYTSNIKNDRREIGCDGVGWLQLTRDLVEWHIYISMEVSNAIKIKECADKLKSYKMSKTHISNHQDWLIDNAWLTFIWEAFHSNLGQITACIDYAYCGFIRPSRYR
jgi:hypothetical protein